MSVLSIAPYFPFARTKILGQQVPPSSSGAIVHVRPDRRYHPRCHNCGRRAATVHSTGHRRFVRDLNMTNRQVWLQVDYRKIWCDRCQGARVEALAFCEAGRRITHRLARYIYDLCKLLPVTQVAAHLALDSKTVKAVEKHFLEQDFGQTDYGGLRILAIDEVAVKKRHHYMTVVLDLTTGRVVWMGEGHDKDTLDRFFAGMSQEQKAAIDAVAVDMWPPYVNRVKCHCPKAKIVFDLFHLVKAFGLVIDEVRREEMNKASAQQRKLIKGSRYLLLRNRKNLKGDQEQRLDELLAANATLNAVYILKDQLKMIYHYRYPPAAKRALDGWCAIAEQVDHWAMRSFIGTLRNHEAGILNHCFHAIGTSPLEGVNNRIKVIKRAAYGFHDMRYFALKVKQAFPGKK
jgi:transposase